MYVPEDVLIDILTYVDKADLPAICRVNKTYREYAADNLYREISFRFGTLPRAAVCRTLIDSPQLAARVRRFEVGGVTKTNDEAMHLLADTLQHLPSLRALDLTADNYIQNRDHKAWVLRNCTFKLKTFCTSFCFNSNLMNFLVSQTELESVTLHSHPIIIGLYPFEPSALSKLGRVSVTSMSWLRILIPGRPIYDVEVHDVNIGSRSYHSFDLSLLSLSTRPILRLTLPIHVLRRTSICQVATTLPSLEELTVTSNANSTHAIEWPHVLEWLASLLSNLHELRDVSVVNGNLRFPGFDEKEMESMLEILDHSKSLEYFTMTSVVSTKTWKRVGGEWVTSTADSERHNLWVQEMAQKFRHSPSLWNL